MKKWGSSLAKMCFVCGTRLEDEVIFIHNIDIEGICCHCYNIIVLKSTCCARICNIFDYNYIVNTCNRCDDEVMYECKTKSRIQKIAKLGLLGLPDTFCSNINNRRYKFLRDIDHVI